MLHPKQLLALACLPMMPIQAIDGIAFAAMVDDDSGLCLYTEKTVA